MDPVSVCDIPYWDCEYTPLLGMMQLMPRTCKDRWYGLGQAWAFLAFMIEENAAWWDVDERLEELWIFGFPTKERATCAGYFQLDPLMQK
jgi:hypothetical protein